MSPMRIIPVQQMTTILNRTIIYSNSRPHRMLITRCSTLCHFCCFFTAHPHCIATAAIAGPILPACLFVRPSRSNVLPRLRAGCTIVVQAVEPIQLIPSLNFDGAIDPNEDTTVQFTSGRTILLASGEVKYIQIFARDQPQ